MYDSTVMRRERAAASVAVVPMPICRSLVTAGLEDTVQRPPSQHLAQRSRYDKTVIHSDYPGFFAAGAATAGALTGLLFVAMSVAARHDPGYIPPVIRQVRAAAALLAFVNALAVSLFGLVPGNGLGIPATVLGVAGISVHSCRGAVAWCQPSSWHDLASPVQTGQSAAADLRYGASRGHSADCRPAPQHPAAVGCRRPRRVAACRHLTRLGTRRRQGHRHLHLDCPAERTLGARAFRCARSSCGR